MSFLGKMKAGLKNVANKVTGGYGEVTVEVHDSIMPGETLKAKIRILAKAELKITNIKAHFEGFETISYSDDEYEEDTRAKSTRSDYSFQHEQELSGELLLEHGDSQEFEFQVTLPDHLPPTFSGVALKNRYHLKVHVDVPWGVDLRESQEIFVLPAAPARCEPTSLQQNDVRFSAQLVLKNPVLKPGVDLEYELVLTPRETLRVKKATISVRSVEFIPGQIGRITREYQQSSQSDEETETERVDWRESELEIESDREEEVLWNECTFSAPQTFSEKLTVPERFGSSYSRGDTAHRIYFYLVIDTYTPEEFEMRQEVILCEGDWEHLDLDNAEFAGALTEGDSKLVERYLRSGMDPNVTLMRFRPLHVAAFHGHASLVELLINHGADKESPATGTGETALFTALEQGKLDCFQLLLDRGADSLAVDSRGNSLLFIAARCGYLDWLKQLTEMGLSLETFNKEGQTCLHYAASAGQLEIVRYCLDQGLPVDLPTEFERHTPLFLALQQDRLEVARELLKRGADFNLPARNGFTPAMVAVNVGSINLLEEMISRGLDPYFKDDNGWTFLHYAAARNQVNVIKFFLDKGLDVNARDNEGRTPRRIANNSGKFGALSYLEQVGGEID